MPPGTTEWAGPSYPSHLFKQNNSDGPPGARLARRLPKGSLRQRTAEVKYRLLSIESNPGPGVRRGRRRVSEGRREARRVGRHVGRRERREREVREGGERVVVGEGNSNMEHTKGIIKGGK